MRTIVFEQIDFKDTRDRDILARLRFGHQRPLNRRCPDEKYQYVNNNRLTEYPGTLAWGTIGHPRFTGRWCPILIGHPRFTGRWCPNLNLVKISLSLSRALRIHSREW